ncbi:lanthionine synthetase C family protein [Taibaiella chishuiensis]|uniref:Lanthionine synthetase-like protein n=1 Tax=Taibaiella chishuiensis TaxID=1434707 RepID=A0A2P8DBZ7_9BACT|nr:lanthionine synthetase C family protein [Taibaiella chishuiensis]PSK94705.1 lanthionine synthetase-like protein [Taibaiella chishuiensis]
MQTLYSAEPLSLNAALLQKLQQIRQVLDGQLEIELPSLFSGLGGIILFYGYLYKCTGDEAAGARMYSLIDRMIEVTEQIEVDDSFSHGITGIAWCLQHLVNAGMLDPAYEENIRDFDELIFEAVRENMSLFRYDYFVGMIGKGRYFLERYASDKSVKSYLDQLIEILFSFRENHDQGILWQDYYGFKREHAEKRVTTLGMAHGLSSILAFLSLAQQAGVLAPERAADIQRLASYIRSCRTQTDGIDFYPYHMVNDERESEHITRMAWCHGDPGVTLSLMMAALQTGDQQLYNDTLSYGLELCTRQDQEVFALFDAGLCHGTSGLAQIFKRMHLHTGDATFLEASNYWQEETLKMGVFDEGFAGFRVHTGEVPIEWTRSQGFLVGISGIGLSLISSLYNDSGWDRALLFS